MKNIFKNEKITLAFDSINGFVRSEENFILIKGGSNLLLSDHQLMDDIEKGWLEWLSKQGEEETGFLYSPAAAGNAPAMVGELAAAVKNKQLYERYQEEIVQAFLNQYYRAESVNLNHDIENIAFRAAKTFLDNLKAAESKPEEPVKGQTYDMLHARLIGIIHNEFDCDSLSRARKAANRFLNSMVGLPFFSDAYLRQSYTESLAQRLEGDWPVEASEFTKMASRKAAEKIMKIILGE